MLSYYLGGYQSDGLDAIQFQRCEIMEYVREKSKNTKKGDMKISFTILRKQNRLSKDGWGVMESLILVINTLILIFVTM